MDRFLALSQEPLVNRGAPILWPRLVHESAVLDRFGLTLLSLYRRRRRATAEEPTS